MTDRAHFDGKCAVILGASAPDSIGWHTAKAFVERGARVLIAARGEAKLQSSAAAIGADSFVCDGGQSSEIKALSEAARRLFGRIDYAVNCVGLPAPGKLADVTEEDVDRLLRMNFTTNVFFIRHMTEIMKDGGAVTLMSALTAQRPVLPNALYSCAKAATECLVQYAALEYGPRRIRVNSVIPGFTASDFTAAMIEVEGVAEAFAREIPLRCIGKAEDIAEAVLSLSAMEYVSGVNFHVSGGNHLTRLPYLDELPPALFKK